MRYDEPEADEWVRPVVRGYKLACCDCGLVHDVDFRIRKGRVEFRARRSNRSTGQVRRHNGITVRHTEDGEERS